MSCLRDQRAKVRALEDIYECDQEKRNQQEKERSLVVRHVGGDWGSTYQITEATREENFKEGEGITDLLCQILERNKLRV